MGTRSKPKKVTVPATPGAARIIAIANQKGGVGKSTTAVSLGAALAEAGFRILVVDLDPQGNASTGMGIRHESRQITSYDVIVAEASLRTAIVPSPVEGLHAVPSTIDLAGAEIELVSQFSREGRLKRALAEVHDGVYDFIFLDCPPSLGLITVNALTAAEELIVPIQCEYYALEGLGQLLRNVGLVQQNINPELRLTGIVMTMFDPRTKLSEQVVEEVQKFFGDLVYDTIIPRTVRLSEAPGYGVPITVYDPKSKGAECYRALAKEVARRPPPDTPMPSFEDLPAIVVSPMEDAARPEATDELTVDDEEPPTVHEVVEEAARTAEPPKPPDTEPRAPEPPPSGGSGEVEPAPEAITAEPTKVRAPDEDDVWEIPDRAESRVRPAQRMAPGTLPERRVVVIDEDAALGREGGVDPPESSTPPKEAPAEEIGATLHEDDASRRRWRLFRKGGE